MEKAVTIRMSPNRGADTKIFRAYKYGGHGRGSSLNVSASTTGNVIVGVVRCAAKAFARHEETQVEAFELEKRISVEQLDDDIWVAELSDKPIKAVDA